MPNKLSSGGAPSEVRELYKVYVYKKYIDCDLIIYRLKLDVINNKSIVICALRTATMENR